MGMYQQMDSRCMLCLELLELMGDSAVACLDLPKLHFYDSWCYRDSNRSLQLGGKMKLPVCIYGRLNQLKFPLETDLASSVPGWWFEIHLNNQNAYNLNLLHYWHLRLVYLAVHGIFHAPTTAS